MSARRRRLPSGSTEYARRAPPPKDPSTFAKLQLRKMIANDEREQRVLADVELAVPIARRIVAQAIDVPQGDLIGMDPGVTLVRSVALAKHKLDHPRARGDRLWIALGNGRGYTNIACRFCREVLLRGVRLGYSYESETFAHTTLCAAVSLARGSSASPRTP